MSFNGSGVFQINTAGQPVVSGTVISSTAFNALTADLATGLSTCVTKDGQTNPTANLPMANYKFTGLGAGSDATDSANLSQVQSTVVKLIGSVSGADTITGSMTPALAAYAAGQMFYFVAAGDNTGAVTLNINSLGAKSITRDGSIALVAGDILSGEVVVVVYDGTRFQLVTTSNSFGVPTSIVARATIDSVVGNGSAIVARMKNGAADVAGVFWNNATSGDNGFLGFGTEGSYTARGSITYNRGAGLVAYNTSSDYRAKDVYGPVTDSGTVIDSLKVYRGKMHGATIERPMMIAHETQAITPYAVTGQKDAVDSNGNPIYQQVDYSTLVPLLLAEIQLLRVRVAALEL